MHALRACRRGYFDRRCQLDGHGPYFTWSLLLRALCQDGRLHINEATHCPTRHRKQQETPCNDDEMTCSSNHDTLGLRRLYSLPMSMVTRREAKAEQPFSTSTLRRRRYIQRPQYTGHSHVHCIDFHRLVSDEVYLYAFCSIKQTTPRRVDRLFSPSSQLLLFPRVS